MKLMPIVALRNLLAAERSYRIQDNKANGEALARAEREAEEVIQEHSGAKEARPAKVAAGPRDGTQEVQF